MSRSNQQHFILSQINEILRYVEQYPDENPDVVILRWIDECASEYRKNWEKHEFD